MKELPGLGVIAMRASTATGELSALTRLDVLLARMSWRCAEPGWWLLGLAPRRQARIAAASATPILVIIGILPPFSASAVVIGAFAGGFVTHQTWWLIRKYDSLEERFPNHSMRDLRELNSQRTTRLMRLAIAVLLVAVPPYSLAAVVFDALFVACGIWPLYAAAWIMPYPPERDHALGRARRRLADLARSAAPVPPPLPA